MLNATRRIVHVNLIPALNEETLTPTIACSSSYEFKRIPDPHVTLDYRTSPVYNFTVSFVDDTKLGLKLGKKKVAVGDMLVFRIPFLPRGDISVPVILSLDIRVLFICGVNAMKYCIQCKVSCIKFTQSVTLQPQRAKL